MTQVLEDNFCGILFNWWTLNLKVSYTKLPKIELEATVFISVAGFTCRSLFYLLEWIAKTKFP